MRWFSSMEGKVPSTGGGGFLFLFSFFFFFPFEAHKNSRPNLTRCWVKRAPKVKLINGRGGWLAGVSPARHWVWTQNLFFWGPRIPQWAIPPVLSRVLKSWPRLRSCTTSGYKRYVKPQIFCRPFTFLAKYWNQM